MITSLELEPDDPIGDHCGTCRRCIEACPTAAITPYSVDGSRCISYLTLENRGTIAEEFHQPMKDAGFVVGCDICQEVCPFNRRPLPTSEPDFAARAPARSVSLQQILAWSEQEWDILTRGRAFRRAKHAMWQRNAQILRENPCEPH
jgi:epoxyqueuosine reductase